MLPLRSWLGLEAIRALYMVLVMSANPPSLLGSCFGSRLEEMLVMSARPFRPLVLKYVAAVMVFQCFGYGHEPVRGDLPFWTRRSASWRVRIGRVFLGVSGPILMVSMSTPPATRG